MATELTSIVPQSKRVAFGEQMVRVQFDREKMPALKLSDAPYTPPAFDPAVHLCYKPGVQKSMAELGVENDKQISSIGCAMPFPLFTEEAIDIMRAELLREEVFSNCAFKSNLVGKNSTQVRGWTKQYGSFTDAAWKHPATVAAVSEMAGINLTPIFDYEIAHANVAVKDEAQQAADQAKIAYRQSHPESASEDYKTGQAVLSWHFDSYPFVCVLMLSDTSKMVGGETIIHSDSGEISRVNDPKKGWATVLQGRCIEHLASMPLGGEERITFVTSYRATNPLAYDGSVLNTVNPVSDINELHTDWVEYRMDTVADRLKALGNKVRQARTAGEPFSTEIVTAYLKEQEDYIKKTYVEMLGEYPSGAKL